MDNYLTIKHLRIYNIIYGKMVRFQSGELDHRQKSFTWIHVQLLETEVSKNTVLSRY